MAASTPTDLRERDLRERYRLAGQEHVLRFVAELDAARRDAFFDELVRVDLELITKLVRGEDAAAVTGGVIQPAPLIRIPSTDAQRKERERARSEGERMLRDGSVAVLTVAGGQGTRLGFDLPKGMFPIGPVTDRTLFQMFAESLHAAADLWGAHPLWMILTSPATHDATVAYFAEQGRFGLPEDRVRFLMQGSMPAVDGNGKLLLAAKDRLAMSPNGHGGSLLALRDEGGLDAMREAGATTLYYFQVDNPLVPIPDPVLLGHHQLAGAEMSTKVVAKRSPDEKVGVLCERDGQTCVIEYSDLDEELMNERDAAGDLVFRGGNIAVHAMERSFIERIVESEDGLPYHRAHKKIPFVDEQGQRIEPTEPNGTKFEMFVFDALPEATKTVTQEVAREDEFAPVKNATGEDSPETSRRALTEAYARWLREAEVDIPKDGQGLVPGAIEISPRFARDAASCVARVRERGPLEYRDGWVLTLDES